MRCDLGGQWEADRLADGGQMRGGYLEDLVCSHC